MQRNLSLLSSPKVEGKEQMKAGTPGRLPHGILGI